MGKGGAKIEVTQYFMSEHFGICTTADRISRIVIKEKEVWAGDADDITAIDINLPELFGGLKKEGGVKGTAYYLPGYGDQLLPDALAQKLGRANGADCPGFRGISSLFFVGDEKPGFYWTANAPYLPGVWVTVGRVPVAPDITVEAEFDGWYARARIEVVNKSTNLPPGLGFYVNPSGPALSIDQADIGDTWPGTSNDDYPAGIPYVDVDGDGSGMWVYWCDSNVMTATEIDLRLQFPAGSVEPDMAATFSFQFWNELTSGVGTLTPKATSTVISPGSPSDDTGNPFDVDSLVPQNWYFDVDAPAEPETEDIPNPYRAIGSGEDANPAFIIYEALINTDWGMGTSTTAIDIASFTAAGETLFNEDFGLSMIWTRQSTINEFVQEILDHIQAVLYVDPATGLLTLKLVRGDYDPGSLPILNPDNADLSNFSRKLWGDIVNEIVVTWTNPVNEQEETITIQDDASIAIQGGIVSDSRNYYGVRNASLAKMLAVRDLRSAGQPLAACDAVVDRTQWELRPASVVKLTWPEYGLTELVMRVQSVDYGRPGDPLIKLQLVEDVFGLDIGSYDDPPSSAWVDPSAAPESATASEIFTLPYFFTIGAGVDIEAAVYPEVITGILATSDNSDTFSIEAWAEGTLPNGDPSDYENVATNNVIGYATLAADLDAEALSDDVAFDDLIGQTSPTVGGFVIIGDEGEAGNEIAMINASGYDLVRGCLDTVPRAWPAGTPVWFVDESTIFEDTTSRAAAEVVDYKLRTRTSQGLLALGDAPIESITLTERPWLPNRPANVIAYGEAWSAQDDLIDARARPDPWVTVTWAVRNRLDEDALILSWTDASATPETGQTTTIEVRSTTGDLITSHTGLAGTSFDVPDASFEDALIVELRVFSERSDDDGEFVSLQYFSHWVRVADVTFDDTDVTFDSDLITMDGG